MRLVFALFIAFLATGCAPHSDAPDPATVAAQNYDGALEEASRPAQPIVRTDAQKRFIKSLNSRCNELDALLGGCDDYKSFIAEAKQLHQEAESRLGADDPQVSRPTHYVFKKACSCGDLEQATAAAKELAKLQAKLFGRNSSDVKATASELANAYVRQEKTGPTVDELLAN